MNLVIPKLKLIYLLVLLSCHSFGQVLTYEFNNTPQQLVESILPGAGLNPTNITYNGSALNATLVQPSALGFTASGFPFSSGVYFRTVGNYIVSSDPDLQDIANGNPYNGAILDFDFVATGSQFSFSYIFASQEYTSFTCSGFNDAFGFFISGPGISGPYSNGAENIAVVPGTNVPVSINTVNSGNSSGNSDSLCELADPNWQANSIYFTTQYGGFGNQGFNGSTVPLTAESPIICGETYHVKIAICNVLDAVLNSGLYFQVNSFSTNPNFFSLSDTSNLIFEDCNQPATLAFTRGSCDDINDTLVFYTFYGGTAVNGVDFNLLPDSVVVLPNVDTVYWQVTPIVDAVLEGEEDFNISVMQLLNNGDTIYSSGTIIIDEVPPITLNGGGTICLGDSINLSASGAESYVWSPSSGLDNSTSSSVIASPTETTTYTIIGTYENGCTDTQTLTVTIDECLGLTELESQFVVNPNPFLDEINIVSKNNHVMDYVELINVLGEVVLTSFDSKLNVNHVKDGTYFLKIYHNQGFSIVRLLK